MNGNNSKNNKRVSLAQSKGYYRFIPNEHHKIMEMRYSIKDQEEWHKTIIFGDCYLTVALYPQDNKGQYVRFDVDEESKNSRFFRLEGDEISLKCYKVFERNE